MIKLSPAAPKEPFWLTIVPPKAGADGSAGDTGVRIKVVPVTVADVRVARSVMTSPDLLVLTEGLDDAEKLQIMSVAVGREMIRRGIREWEGIGDMNGEPLPATPENIELFLDVFTLYEETERQYVSPVFRLDNEKNA